jgi:hypothetical protein
MYDIYSNARNDSWRFTLGKSGRRKLLTIGLNPSTATKEKSDTTVAKVAGVAQRNGFDGFVMLNLYPVRSTDYNDLPLVAESDAFQENISRIEKIVSSESAPVIWAAWGESIMAREFFVQACLELSRRLMSLGASWRHFGPLTVSGHPRHPSRLNYSWQFSPLDIASYAHALCT